MLVREVMTKRLHAVFPHDSFEKIVKLLVSKRVTGVPVVGKSGKIVGVISEKDLFYKLFPSKKEFYKDLEYYMNFENLEREASSVLKLKARDFMSKKVVSVASDDHVLKACSLFLTHNIRRLPVIDDGVLVGIVTTNNIYKNFLSSLINK